jgi:glycosyltransferase involved in cell wall biosynthesis
MRGGEKVLEEIASLFPNAPIATLVARPERLSPKLRTHPIVTSLLQWVGGVKLYKQMMPIFPWVIPLLKAGRPGGLVISSDASVIKGVTIPDVVPHVCYCHSPPRYLWDLQKTYEEQSDGMGFLAKLVFRIAVPIVREFDRNAAQRVDHFIANSRFVQERIRVCYGRESEVIYPPVDVEGFDPARPREDFYLLVSELTPYKRVDLAIEAFRDFPGRLIIIGDGPEGRRLRSLAPPNVTLMGRQPFAVLKDHFERCKAFLNPQIEDFGITAVEAQAAGAPVIAFCKGGALETVIEGRTGIFFEEQTPESLRVALECLEKGNNFKSRDCREQAEKFRPQRFKEEILEYLEKVTSK